MKRSTVTSLPPEVIIEIKHRLRSGAFDQIHIVSWLKSQGYSISKSAMNRYAIRLRNNDKGFVFDREILSIKNTDIATLFEELGRIKKRETEILAQIQAAILQQDSIYT